VTAHPDIRSLVRSVTVDGPHRYTLLGEVRSDVGSDRMPDALAEFARLEAYRGDTSEQAQSLAPFLAAEIYGRLYARASSPPLPTSDVVVLRDFIDALSDANCGSGGWERGWTAVGVDGERVMVRRDEVTFWASRDQVRADQRVPEFPAPCDVFVGKELRRLIAGFYTAVGDAQTAGRAGDPGPPLLRVYWNLTSVGAVPFIALATQMLNAAAIPFRLKVLADPGHYVRADAGVLYVDRRDFAACSPHLRVMAARLRPHLGSHPPRLTKLVWPGVGFAESPARESFGISRSKLLACALWSCWQHGITEPVGRLAHVSRFVAAAGYDPDRPYLEPGGCDSYEPVERAGGTLQSGHVQLVGP
jgi:hypothetical protein